MTIPRTPAEYYRQVGGKLNWLERLIDEATSFDERQNISNLLLMEILKEIAPQLGPVTPPLPPSIPYTVKEFDLATERPEPGEPIDIPGNTITARTDGSLQGIAVRLDSPSSDLISFAEVNPYLYPPGFTKLYLQNTAQPGKYLRLYLGTSGAVASVELTSVTFAINVEAAEIMLPIDVQGAAIQMPIDVQGAYIQMPVDVQGALIQMPVDLQSSYIMMPVDIQAQYVTLEMDIVAQSLGNIAIDIAAQTVGNIDINLAASVVVLDMNLAASAIMMPVDIQAQYAALGVDIVAQTIGNLNIDIAAQTVGNLDINLVASAVVLDINLAASDVTLDMNIKAQDVTIEMDIEAQSVGIFLQPEWAALQGIDKNFYGDQGDRLFSQSHNVYYTVPAGKTLFLCGAACGSLPENEAEYDHFLNVNLAIWNHTTSAVLCRMGGVAGCGATFPKPLMFPSGEQMRLAAFNYANISCVLLVSGWGYEV